MTKTKTDTRKSFTFETKLGWSYTMFEENKKDAINRFLDEVGTGIPFVLHR